MENFHLVDSFGLLDNAGVVDVICFFLLAVIGLFYLQLWIFVFSASFSYVAFDTFISLFFHEGEGYIKFGFDNEFKSKGHGLIVFFFLILVGTVLASTLTDWVVDVAVSRGAGGLLVLTGSGMAILMVFADLEWRF